MNGISVIICCYNSGKRIGETLGHLQKQNFNISTAWEVIIVDNASTDDTTQTAYKIWKTNPVTELNVFKEEKPGLMEARKKGLIEAKYEIVAFIDDDNWIEHDWLQKVFEVFSMDPKIGACGGKSEAIFEKEKPFWFEDNQSSFAVGHQADQSGMIDDKKGFLWGAGLSIRKQIWEDLQRIGFQNLTLGREGKKITAGEDTELCYAIRLLGYNLYYRHDLSLRHYMPDIRMKISYLIKLSEGFGKAYAKLNCYRVLLGRKKFKLHAWWYEWLVARKNIIKFYFKEIIARDDKKKIKFKTIKAYNKGYAIQVWVDKTTTKENVEILKNIFKH